MISQPCGKKCRTCERPWSSKDFYTSTAECRSCKQDRSRQNRLIAARKIALAERFIDALAELAMQGRVVTPHVASLKEPAVIRS